MAKRKTIKHNPLDSLSTDSAQEPPVGIETLLTASDEHSMGIAAKPSRKGKPIGGKVRKPKSQSVSMETMVVTDEEPEEEGEKESPVLPPQPLKNTTMDVSPDHLAQRISQLEEDNRLQNIMIGIIMVPLALLALPGAAPV